MGMSLLAAAEVVAKLRIGLTGVFGLTDAAKNGRFDQARTDRVHPNPPAKFWRRFQSAHKSN
jgi:hypothetical protein